MSNPEAREKIQKYWLEWRHIQPITNGHTLRDLGLPPGPRYSIILKRLQDAWLDGKVTNEIEEKKLLQELINDGSTL